MRDRRLGFRHPLGDHAAHGRQFDRFRRGRFRHDGGPRRGADRFGRGRSRGEHGVDIGLDDPPPGPAAAYDGEIEPRLGRHAPGERACRDPLFRRGTGGRRFGCALRGGFYGGYGFLRRRRRVRDGGRVLALGDQDADHGVDRNPFGALGHDDLAQHALVDRFDLHRRLVGLDLGDDVPGLNGIALVLEPFGEVSLGHGRRQCRHQDIDRHRMSCLGSVRAQPRYSTSLAARTTSSTWGSARRSRLAA